MVEEIYNRIEILSKEKGLTLRELADKLEYSKPVFSQMRYKKTWPSAEMALKLAEFFEISLDYLFFGKDVNNIPDIISPVLRQLRTLTPEETKVVANIMTETIVSLLEFRSKK